MGVLAALVAAAALGLPSSWTAVAHGPAGGTVWSGRIPNHEVAWDKRASAVYLPPDYSADRRYPVIYLLHGLSGSPSSYYDGLHLADVADLDGQCDGHVREDDGVFQGDEQEVAQGCFTLQFV